MQNSKFNFASVFSLMVLLMFSYITFLGLVYWRGGDLLVPLGLTFLLIAVVVGCVFIMCKAKATRWKRIGMIGQIFFGIIIFVALLAASIPFTNFLRVAKDSDDIDKKVSSACDAAINLDSAYVKYVDKRLEDYKTNLFVISKGKHINPSEYNESLKNAAGNTDDEKIQNLERSLRNKLLPDSTETIVKERQKWLNKAKKTSVWNPLMPSNISKVDKNVNGWLGNYKQISECNYKGEVFEYFTYRDFSSQLKKLTDTYTKFQMPSLIAIAISLICFFIMLLPYIVTEESLEGKETETLYE